MHRELPEDSQILQGLEQLPIEFLSQIDIPFGAISEPKVDRVIADVLRMLNSWYHLATPEV